MEKNVAIILAAGKGIRMGKEKGKLFLPLQGRPLLAWTLLVFESFREIEEIIVVVPPGEEDEYQKNFLLPYNISKAKKLIPGGPQRQDSLWNGFQEIYPPCKLVVVHDGARPFLEEEILKNALEAAESSGAAVVAIPVKDTIKVEDGTGMVRQTLSRNNLWLAQTPQVYQYPILKKALEKAKDEDFYGTDDSSLVERIGFPIKIVPGSYENIKVTTPEDLIFGEAILQRRLNKTLNSGANKIESRYWL